MSGPSDKAVEAFENAVESREEWRDWINAAHDPALGLDRSVCLRDAVEVFKRLTRDPLNPPEPDDFEREFTNEH